ncbi:Isocitrate lyase [Frankliniella fusca]|uniref:Isocitrate lyase n=1 Tax=Frankliniella fusca TaxID=407009 RepID=A0AAE1LVN4_9NEOP|nr:Isocitrate lyase [Frankliniella fusca]
MARFHYGAFHAQLPWGYFHHEKKWAKNQREIQHHGKSIPMEYHDVPCTMGSSMVFWDWDATATDGFSPLTARFANNALFCTLNFLQRKFLVLQRILCNQLLHRAKRFSLEGVVECLALMGLPFFNEYINNVEKYCDPLGPPESVEHRLCCLRQLARIGPESTFFDKDFEDISDCVHMISGVEAPSGDHRNTLPHFSHLAGLSSSSPTKVTGTALESRSFGLRTLGLCHLLLWGALGHSDRAGGAVPQIVCEFIQALHAILKLLEAEQHALEAAAALEAGNLPYLATVSTIFTWAKGVRNAAHSQYP